MCFELYRSGKYLYPFPAKTLIERQIKFENTWAAGLWKRTLYHKGTAVAQWLRYCATNWKVAGSIPDGVIGIFH